MKDIEPLLRETLNDECWALPVADGALATVERGARRRRRRAVSFAAVATAAAAVAAVGIMVAPSGHVPPGPAAPPSSATTIGVPGGGPVSALLATPRSLYVLVDSRVHRIDRTTHRVLASSPQVTGGEGGRLLIAGRGTTLWVRYTDYEGRTSVQGLDATNLAHKATITTEEKEQADYFVTTNALWSTVSGSRLLRRDPDTGAITRSVACDCRGSVVAADETADVAWIWFGADSWASTTVWAVKLSTGELKGRRTLASGVPSFAPEGDGTLWVATGSRRFVRLSPNGVRELATAGPRWVGKPGLQSPAGTYGNLRVWRYDGLNGRLSCLKRPTGDVLATYPVTPDRGPDMPLVGDDHEAFTTRDGKIVILRGPDGCLS